MLDAWTRAAGAFKRLNARSREGRAAARLVRAFLTLWGETANEVLLETQRSDAFLETQREVLKASTDLSRPAQSGRVLQRDVRLPTRAELDDVHKTVTELRRELRALKRSMPRKAPLPQAPQVEPNRRRRDSAPRPPGRPAASKRKGTRS